LKEKDMSDFITEGHPAIQQRDPIHKNLTTYAPPILREIAARAAEAVAKVGDAAGPAAQRAAVMTQAGGSRLATRSRAIASDIRRQGRESVDAAPHDPSATNDPSSA
jgi:hypothetical protein